MYIPVSRNLEDYSDDEVDGEFAEGDFINPPLVVKRGNESKRGRVLKANIPSQSLSANSSHSHYVQRFISKLRFEGREEEFAHNMFVVIGLNRPRSLSSARNKALYAEYNSKLETDVRHEVQAFFWDRVWHKSFNQKEVKY